FFQAEDGIRYDLVTGVQTCALPIYNEVCVITRYPLAVLAKVPDCYFTVEAEGHLDIHRSVKRERSATHRSRKIAHGSRYSNRQRSEERRVGKEREARSAQG